MDRQCDETVLASERFRDWLSERVDGELRLDPKKCPGLPWCRVAPTNGKVFDYPLGLVYLADNVEILRYQVIERWN